MIRCQKAFQLSKEVPQQSRITRKMANLNLKINDLKIYVPAENFEESKQFYRDLGFELTEAWPT